jgi:hypothetical protein
VVPEETMGSGMRTAFHWHNLTFACSALRLSPALSPPPARLRGDPWSAADPHICVGRPRVPRYGRRSDNPRRAPHLAHRSFRTKAGARETPARLRSGKVPPAESGS